MNNPLAPNLLSSEGGDPDFLFPAAVLVLGDELYSTSTPWRRLTLLGCYLQEYSQTGARVRGAELECVAPSNTYEIE